MDLPYEMTIADIREDNSMGMMINTGSFNSSRIQIKDLSGRVVATITRSNSNKKKTGSLKSKRLNYNFKQISTQIMMAKTSSTAKGVVIKARAKVVQLLRKQTGLGSMDSELAAAIIHAKKMERIAKKRVNHLKEEENAARGNSFADEFENNKENDELLTEGINSEDLQGLSHEELKELMQELQELMEELQDELEDETGLDELTDQLMFISTDHMDENDLERLKKKHRSDELREIMEADMKYLKALFDKLEKEKQSAASSGIGNNNDEGYDNSSGISLELCGMDIPVETTPQPVMTEGGSIDLSV